MRRPLTIATTLAVSLFALAATAIGAPTKDSFGLKGEVYAAGFKIEMKNAANRKLTSVKAGTYRIKIEDEATTTTSDSGDRASTERRPSRASPR